MAQANTPPWAKRIENKIDQLLQDKSEHSLKKCRYHQKYGPETKKKCDPPCEYSLSLAKRNQAASLSPIVANILNYWKPVKSLSPVKNLPSAHRDIEQDIVPINAFNHSDN